MQRATLLRRAGTYLYHERWAPALQRGVEYAALRPGHDLLG